MYVPKSHTLLVSITSGSCLHKRALLISLSREDLVGYAVVSTEQGDFKACLHGHVMLCLG